MGRPVYMKCQPPFVVNSRSGHGTDLALPCICMGPVLTFSRLERNCNSLTVTGSALFASCDGQKTSGCLMKAIDTCIEPANPNFSRSIINQIKRQLYYISSFFSPMHDSFQNVCYGQLFQRRQCARGPACMHRSHPHSALVP